MSLRAKRIRSAAARCLAAALLVFVFSGLAAAQQEIVQEVQIHGNRRIPAETLRARIFTRAGDVYDPAGMERDFNSLWNTGYFEDLRIEREDSAKGYIIHIYVKERPTIRRIEYKGLSSVSQSDVLDRFKERKVGLTVENQYDPTKIKKAEVVLKELLGEHGRQFAKVTPEIHPIPPAAVEVVFNIVEGPKVKVGKIKFEGNKNIHSRTLRAAMKNLKPIGIPHSIFLESLFSKTYDASKLTEDAERVRNAYQEKGYFKALVHDPKTQVRDSGGINFPFFWKGKHGKAVDITMPIEEGGRYRLGTITFKNNRAITNQRALRGMFPIRDGDIFNTDLIRKGLDNLRKGYGELGYINFTSVPDTKIDDEKHLVSLEIDVDEGKPFYVRRIEFQGNTTTRDKVIRRELAVEEGGVYNSRLWDQSILRLNQLNYFETLKAEQDTEIRRNETDGTVDLTLKLKEKGKNQIGLNGGVSGLSGSFIGLNYQTNNFLGLGETLTIEANVGSRQKNILFGFTEPYMFDRPLQTGFTVYYRQYNYNQAQLQSQFTNQPINLPQNFLNTLQNYNQSSVGMTVFASYPLRHSFKRVGLTYSLDNSTVNTFSDASRSLFESIQFRSVDGPNALKGIVTSKVLPSFSFSTINSTFRPTGGQSLYAGGEISGLGGNVRTIRPIVEYKRWFPMRGIHFTHDPGNAPQILGVRIQGSFLTGWGDIVAPPFERFYLGGDNDLRGFDVRTLSPVIYLVQKVNFPLLNPDGTTVPVDKNNPRRGNIAVPIPARKLVFPGGDTSIVSNVEYRIPIAGPVTLAIFNDFGMNMALRPSQLRLSTDSVNALNTGSFGCSDIDITFQCVGVSPPLPAFSRSISVISGTNYVPRMSTGLELQVLMPVINAPLRVYYAYNPLRMNTLTQTPNQITRDMFPVGGAGDFSYQQALRAFSPGYRLSEPKSTFRFTVSTTF
ncbi:MAG: outer membrane protein assembly factor BamA [Candidatus Koribacter versatilis]|uniref:Outer membrane protein assembly factor BamA n=1 Tax=Candidatus Korobacter versatilis TaxID=658062 RepID=A0A932A961_9BACT|nr:outer membrane protein assembly factor BamA [Candidatus Koribacter versatilis]